MEKIDLGKYEPSCILAHRLTNKLAVIVGHCDLLLSEAPDESSICSQRLLTISKTAKEIARELNQHQCRLDTAIKASASKPQQTESIERRSAAVARQESTGIPAV
jgi:hypothetical protein